MITFSEAEREQHTRVEKGDDVRNKQKDALFLKKFRFLVQRVRGKRLKYPVWIGFMHNGQKLTRESILFDENDSNAPLTFP